MHLVQRKHFIKILHDTIYNISQFIQWTLSLFLENKATEKKNALWNDTTLQCHHIQYYACSIENIYF